MGRGATLLSLLVVAACGIPGPSTLRYGEVHVVAGTRTVYFDVRKHWTEYLTVDGNVERSKHVGVLAVDVDTFWTRYEKGKRFPSFGARDPRGRVFESRGHAIVVRDRDGRERELCRDVGEIWGITLCVDGDTTWVFFKRFPSTTYPDGRRVTRGNYAVVRVHGETGEKADIPLPDGYVWDWLTVQNPRFAFVTGRGRRFRTWRADFARRALDEPIEGDFLVIDDEGTLLERRDCRMFEGYRDRPPNVAEIIRDGERGTVDLGLPGRVHAVFGTGRVVLRDPATKRYVLRSLRREPDRWLPGKPPIRRSVELGPE